MGLRKGIAAIGALLRGPAQPKVLASYVLFKPKRDITTYELALIMATIRPGDGRPISFGFYWPAKGPTLEEAFRSQGAPGADRHFAFGPTKEYG